MVRKWQILLVEWSPPGHLAKSCRLLRQCWSSRETRCFAPSRCRRCAGRMSARAGSPEAQQRNAEAVAEGRAAQPGHRLCLRFAWLLRLLSEKLSDAAVREVQRGVEQSSAGQGWPVCLCLPGAHECHMTSIKAFCRVMGKSREVVWTKSS